MKTFFIILLFFCSIPLLAQENDCKSFRIGTFQYLDSNDVVTVQRDEKKQIETSSLTRVKTTFKIKWTSDCTYQIKQIWSTDKARRKDNGGWREVIITNRDKDGYDYTCSCKTLPGVPPFGGRMKKIK